MRIATSPPSSVELTIRQDDDIDGAVEVTFWENGERLYSATFYTHSVQAAALRAPSLVSPATAEVATAPITLPALEGINTDALGGAEEKDCV